MYPNITLFIESDYDAMSAKAADIFTQALNDKPNGAFGFATGGTPVGLYSELVRRSKNGVADFSQITTFNLDEYYPISPDNTQSYRYFMRDQLFNHVNIDLNRTHIPNGQAADVAAECKNYESLVSESGGIYLQILGIGANGHIGFNEPADSFTAETLHVTLKELTIQSNARFFGTADEVPRHAITMGIRTIMMSRRIMLLCSGAGKAEILRDALYGPITPLVPASVLQMHRDVTVVADREAAALL